MSDTIKGWMTVDSGFLLVLEVARVSGNLERKSLRVSPVRDYSTCTFYAIWAAGFQQRIHRFLSSNVLRFLRVFSGFQRLLGLRNLWKLFCPITDVAFAKFSKICPHFGNRPSGGPKCVQTAGFSLLRAQKFYTSSLHDPTSQ